MRHSKPRICESLHHFFILLGDKKTKYLKNMEFCPTVNIRSFLGTNRFPGVEDISKVLIECLGGVGKKQHSIMEKEMW